MTLTTFEPWTELTPELQAKIPMFKDTMQYHKHPYWIKGAALCELLGESSTSTIRRMVAYLRAYEHYPICSEGTGYCLATESWQLNDTIEHLQGRLVKQQLTMQGACEAQAMMARKELGTEQLQQLKML